MKQFLSSVLSSYYQSCGSDPGRWLAFCRFESPAWYKYRPQLKMNKHLQAKSKVLTLTYHEGTKLVGDQKPLVNQTEKCGEVSLSYILSNRYNKHRHNVFLFNNEVIRINGFI